MCIHHLADYLKGDLMKALDDKLRVTGKFNVRGALGIVPTYSLLQPLTCAERIASQAPQERGVPREGGTNKKLIALAGLPEFVDIAKNVSKERGIRFGDLMACTTTSTTSTPNMPTGMTLLLRFEQRIIRRARWAP